MEGLILEIVLF